MKWQQYVLFIVIVGSFLNVNTLNVTVDAQTDEQYLTKNHEWHGVIESIQLAQAHKYPTPIAQDLISKKVGYALQNVGKQRCEPHPTTIHLSVM